MVDRHCATLTAVATFRFHASWWSAQGPSVSIGTGSPAINVVLCHAWSISDVPCCLSQVVSTALPESRNPEQVSVTVKAPKRYSHFCCFFSCVAIS